LEEARLDDFADGFAALERLALAAGFEDEDDRLEDLAEGLDAVVLLDDDLRPDDAFARADEAFGLDAVALAPEDDFAREEVLVSPASARSLFTVRAAISAARPFWPRFS
jgi:hypothetical protein